ncbi:hypothetical protein CQY20_31370 [Mycolicibacterium agri]|uniref:Uncharacterized protein n=1 Tax=Mycolicibacterium agri TaxID=36811 RepID=A0A2A7MNL8_MYCAG|nr:hypothetical protein [Mycolicibacterium agri]PEG33325.1 hypothetical protein CQY20_31370 [Mycolicibacterium agri]GFG50542.1 hypothetical protein MAGR_19830 [Mycolicibacterium agri]
MHLIGEGLIALTRGEPRIALDHLLESLDGRAAIGDSRVQQKWFPKLRSPRCFSSVRRGRRRVYCHATVRVQRRR